MRLINIHTLELEEFVGNAIPKYCILSHRWTDDEITYKDFRKGRRKDSAGYRKIASFCNLVRDHVRDSAFFQIRRWINGVPEANVQHVWVDTCCINKDSSAELTEAINSMYTCHWFHRGWTLQELLAPGIVIFCDEEWHPFGWVGSSPHRKDLAHLDNMAEHVSGACGIAQEHLRASDQRLKLNNIPIAEKMSWAHDRVTTRIEDEAYSLMGLFDVNMPLLYGEGNKAFQRLQQELIKTSNDQSIFAWTQVFFQGDDASMFAALPIQFKYSGQVRRGEPCEPYELTNRGLRFVVEYMDLPSTSRKHQEVLIRLNCSVEKKARTFPRGEHDTRAVMMTLRKQPTSDQWSRGSLDNLGNEIVLTDENRAGPDQTRLNEKVKQLLVKGKWQKPRVFFVDAFRREE